MPGMSKDVAIVASHNSMSIETNAEAAPMRVNLGLPEVYPAARSRHCWASLLTILGWPTPC